MSTPATPVVGLSAQEISQLVQQASQASAAAHKAAQEAQQIAQSIDQNISALKQTAASSTVEKEVAETMAGEQFQSAAAGKTARLATTDANDAGILFLNQKALADDTQLKKIRLGADLYNVAIAQLIGDLHSVNSVKFQHMQNAVAAAKQLDTVFAEGFQSTHKQLIEHSHLAHDSFWNPVSAGAGMNLTAGAAPANRIVDTTGAVASGAEATASAAIAVAVAKSIDATITPVMAVLQQVVALLTAQQAAKA